MSLVCVRSRKHRTVTNDPQHLAPPAINKTTRRRESQRTQHNGPPALGHPWPAIMTMVHGANTVNRTAVHTIINVVIAGSPPQTAYPKTQKPNGNGQDRATASRNAHQVTTQNYGQRAPRAPPPRPPAARRAGAQNLKAARGVRRPTRWRPRARGGVRPARGQTCALEAGSIPKFELSRDNHREKSVHARARRCEAALISGPPACAVPSSLPS